MAGLCHRQGSCLHILLKGLKTAYTGLGECLAKHAINLLIPGAGAVFSIPIAWSIIGVTWFHVICLAGCNRLLQFRCKPHKNGRRLFLGQVGVVGAWTHPKGLESLIGEPCITAS